MENVKCELCVCCVAKKKKSMRVGVRCVVCVVTLGRRVCVGCAALVGVSLVVHVQKKKKKEKRNSWCEK